MINIELVYNLSVLVALSALSGFIAARFNRRSNPGKILQGILFGTTAIIGMMYPFILTEGIIFDGRSIVISLCTLFFGPVSGGIALVFAILYRASIDGQGLLTGVFVIISSFLIGLYFHYQKHKTDKYILTNLRLYLFGLFVHIAMMILLLTLPANNFSHTYSIVTLTVIGLFPLVSVLIGNILLAQENNEVFIKEIKDSKERWQFAIEGIDEGVWDWDLNTNKVFYSARWKSIIGYEEHELSNDLVEWEKRVHPDDLDYALNEIQKHIKMKVPVYNSEHRLICKDGNYKWVLDRGKVLVKNSDGTPARMVGTIKDITERKDIEKKLQQSEERFRKIFENAKIGIYRTTSSGNILMANSELVKMLGYPSFEVLASRNIEKGGFGPSYPRKDFIKMIEKNNEVINFESEWIRLDGSVFFVSENAQVIRDSDNKILYYDGVVEDITARKQAEQELIENKEKFKQLFTSLHDGFALHEIILDKNGTPVDYIFLEANPAFENMTGLKSVDIVGKNVKDVLPTVDNSWIIKYGEVALTGKSLKSENYVPEFKKHYRVHAYSPAKYKFATIIEDITEAKNKETKINQLFLAVEQSPVTVIITDVNGVIEYVNPKFTELTQYTSDEAIGKKPSMLKTGYTNELDYKLMWEQIKNGNEWSGIFYNKKKDGQLFWESATISPLRNSEGKITHFVAVKMDITQRIETENELEDYRRNLESLVASRTKEIERINKELISEIEKKEMTEMLLQQSLEKEKELNQLKSRFISTASHEFRTPLTTILSSAELIQRYGKKWDAEKYEEHLERITNSVEYLTDLMDDVLTISRIESGKVVFNPSQINLYDLCLKVITDIKQRNGEEHIFVFNYLTKQKIFYLDHKQIQIILQNLLSNASKYSPNGGKIELIINSNYTNYTNLKLNIIDEGIGIPENDIEHLFEPFYRSLQTENIQGTGLGLSIVKHAVELHNGNIEVKSEFGKGSNFIITIPLRED